MTQQISVVIKTVGALTVTAGVVADAAGNLWNLPGSVNVPSGGTLTVTAAADAANPNAPWPGSGIVLTIENPQAGWTSATTAPILTPVEFITNLPEFANATNFPVAGVQYWLNIAYLRLPSRVWGTLLDLGAQLYAAHNLTIEFRNARAAANGAPPGEQVGPLNSKSVSKVAAGYDTAAGSVEDAGNYNLTNYGTRFMELVDIIGSQGIAQIGTGCWWMAGTVIGG